MPLRKGARALRTAGGAALAAPVADWMAMLIAMPCCVNSLEAVCAISVAKKAVLVPGALSRSKLTSTL